MAQTIQIANATYPDVPSIVCNKSGGGTAVFADPSGTTAVAADVASGKYFLDSSGVLTQGTASGGGGSSWTHILTQKIAVSTTETSVKTAATLDCGSAIYTSDKIVWVHIRDVEGARPGYFYGSDAFFINWYKANGSTSNFIYPAVVELPYATNSRFDGSIAQYGVYGYSISSTGSLIVRRRYQATYSLTINSTYKIDVYTLDLPDGLTLFG